MSRKKVLYLAHRIPFPPNKGDKIRSFNEIKHLAQKYDLYLGFLIDDPADLKHVEALREYCVDLAWDQIDPKKKKIKSAPHMLLGRALSLPYFYSADLQRTIDRWIEEQHFDAVLCFSGPMAEYVFKSNTLDRRSDNAPRLVMDFCDVDSDKWGQYAADARFPMNIVYGLEQKRLLAYEARVNHEFDYSIFVTDNEARLFEELVPGARNVKVVGNGVDFEFFNPAAVPDNTVDTTTAAPRRGAPMCAQTATDPAHNQQDDTPRRGEACLAQPATDPAHNQRDGGRDQGAHRCAPTTAEPMRLVFTGAMDYHANVDAVTWFCRDILPIVRESGIDPEFYIVGGRPAPAVKALEQIPGVAVTGFVDDIRTWYARADVCVLPMRLGRGVQNKVLEAMAMQRPVVTTTKAAEGVGAKDLQHLLVADSPEDIAKSVIELCKNPNARKQLGEAGRTYVTENFDWKRNMEKLEKLLG
jgi:glycosyltransferase involved in cell wall biosynthesis